MDFLDHLGNFKRLKKESMQWSRTHLQLVRRLFTPFLLDAVTDSTVPCSS